MLALTATAEAGLPRSDLAAVTAAPPEGAHLDLTLAAPDTGGTTRTLGAILDGRPGFLSFVDYTCKTLCGTDLAFLSAAIERARLDPSTYRVVVLGIDDK